jgi:zinc transport system substrate-binding protein
VVTRIVLTAAAAVLAVGCGGEEPTEALPGTERTRVVAAFYPLAFAAERVGGEAVEVTNLTPPGAEPHDLELSARDVGRIHDADVVLYLGGGFQPALERALAGRGVRGVDLLEGIELRHEDEDGHGHDDAGHDDADGIDPHVWLDPRRYARLVERIGTELDAGPRASSLVAELEALHEEYEQGLSDCERREIVTSHASFGYLAERYGLEQVAISGLSPEAEPSARDLERVIEEVQEHGATTVFFETLVSPRLAETVARETGAETAVLDPLEGLTPDAEARGDDYFSVMRRNLGALREALGCG